MTDLNDILASATGAWRLAADRSTVAFRTRTAWGLATVTGGFREFSGDAQVAEGVTGRVVIRATSLQTGIGMRDKHLRSVEFFDVEAHPEILVEVSGAQPAADSTAVLSTILTVRGTSRPVALPVDVRVLDDTALQVSGQCTVERADFGVSGNLLGMVGPVAALSATLVFVRVASGPTEFTESTGQRADTQ